MCLVCNVIHSFLEKYVIFLLIHDHCFDNTLPARNSVGVRRLVRVSPGFGLAAIERTGTPQEGAATARWRGLPARTAGSPSGGRIAWQKTGVLRGNRFRRGIRSPDRDRRGTARPFSEGGAGLGADPEAGAPGPNGCGSARCRGQEGGSFHRGGRPQRRSQTPFRRNAARALRREPRPESVRTGRMLGPSGSGVCGREADNPLENSALVPSHPGAKRVRG